MHIPQWLKIVVVLETAVFANLAHAGTVTFATASDNWTANWTSPTLSLVKGSCEAIGGCTTGPTALTVTFPDLNPISITFTEIGTNATFNFGFRLTGMSESVTNNSGVAWKGFTETLVDPTPDTFGPPHPTFAHFHTDPGFVGSLAPFALTGGGAAAATFQFGSGTVNNGSTWNPTGFGIHEYQTGNSIPRAFTLVLAPVVPEPGTFVLVLGVAVLAGARRIIRRPN